MVIRKETITRRLEELDEVVQELSQYRFLAETDLQSDLSQRWIIERGLIAAAALILDISDHIVSGHFGNYVDTYEDSLSVLREREVISEALYQDIQGLGGFRNILVHLYQEINPALVWENYQKGLTVFPGLGKRCWPGWTAWKPNRVYNPAVLNSRTALGPFRSSPL